jgi:hypothetical protein
MLAQHNKPILGADIGPCASTEQLVIGIIDSTQFGQGQLGEFGAQITQSTEHSLAHNELHSAIHKRFLSPSNGCIRLIQIVIVADRVPAL